MQLGEFDRTYYEARRDVNNSLAAQASSPELRTLHMHLAQIYSHVLLRADVTVRGIDREKHPHSATSMPRGSATSQFCSAGALDATVGLSRRS
jgi:hypothetical protein